ncbi:hypothetical protein [Leptolyngbya ohadii]|uniref:hypothetical protein n=1 Tax=Leptolyngbya ohadii TaxID=1962290 RepID=UPI0015C6795C|nr:hypothetical protein [Leptolyngbya ohadii]
MAQLSGSMLPIGDPALWLPVGSVRVCHATHRDQYPCKSSRNQKGEAIVYIF